MKPETHVTHPNWMIERREECQYEKQLAIEKASVRRRRENEV